MERIDIKFSRKNVIEPNLWNYKRSLLDETEKFKERVRWAVFYYKHPELKRKKNNQSQYKLKTDKVAPLDPDLNSFEEKPNLMVKRVELREIASNPTQARMKKDCIGSETR